LRQFAFQGKELMSQIPLPVRFVGVRIAKIEAALVGSY
jgi:hypothetical protein